MLISGENYINIQGWMRTELGLSGNELLVYAIIYGFSQDGQSYYRGSASYIADWCGITKRAVLMILKKLTDKGFLEKEEVVENSVKFCHYRGKIFTGGVKNFHRGGEKISPGGGEKFSPYNIDINNKEDNKEDNKERSAGRFSPPTLAEVKEYCLSRNNRVNPEAFINFYASKGWRIGSNVMKDWKAAVRTWESRVEYDTSVKKRSSKTKEIEFEKELYG